MFPPSGTVTFLFTDIEGSTKLAQMNPEGYLLALQKHHNILNEAVSGSNGCVFKSVGDAFCCAFENCADAVKAAIEAQVKFNATEWGDVAIKVRMGIHSGTAEWNGKDYMGYITLARSNRVMSSAYGNQILISEQAHENLGDAFLKDVNFRDLGERRLKDLIQPVKLFQIMSPQIPSDFPPLKTLDARPNNLPVQLTSFIGRVQEMSKVKELLEVSRLVTLLGPGGTGKTRIAMQIGAELINDFMNGVFVAELAPVTDPLRVSRALIDTLGIKELPNKSPEETIIDYLKDKSLLLLLDNCEHLIDACATLSEKLLANCAKLKILATSREALKCDGERIYRLEPLSVPDVKKNYSPEELAQFEAVRLFIERALTVNAGFRITNDNTPALSQICYQLDGIPLAIELAAARINVLTIDGISERLNDRFRLLTGGNRTALPRQQTLRALIDWSYDLLSENEKLLCRRLTVFSGGWTLESSEKICSDELLDEYEVLDLLENLTDKSLVKIVEEGYNSRYNMLESIRKYGNEKLIKSGEEYELYERHFNYCFQLAENSGKKLIGNEQREWIKKIAQENDNIRECLRWALLNNPESALKLSVELGKFWELQSHFMEGLEFLKKSMESSKNIDLKWKAKAIYWMGFFLTHQGKYNEAKKYLNQCLDIFSETGDKDGEALTYLSLGMIAVFESDYKSIDSFSQKSLSISLGLNNKSYIARNLQNIGLGLMQQGNHDSARTKMEESLSIYRELNDTLQIAKIIGNLGALEYLLTNYDKARILFEESLVLRRELGDKQGISIALSNLGSVAYMQKDFEEAEKCLLESLEIIKEIGDKRVYVTAINTLANIAYDTGDYPKAVQLFCESLVIADEIGDNYSIAKDFEGFANIYIAMENYEMGCRMAGKYISLMNATNRNLIEGELERIENTKEILKSKLGDTDFEKYWSEGENMNIESALKYVSSETFEKLNDK